MSFSERLLRGYHVHKLILRNVHSQAHFNALKQNLQCAIFKWPQAIHACLELDGAN